MQIKIGCTVSNLKVSEVNPSIVGFTLSNINKELENDFLTKGIQDGLGGVAVHLFRTHPFFYLNTHYELEDGLSNEEAHEVVKDNVLLYQAILSNFVIFLWFVKDNCCKVNPLYAILIEQKRLIVHTSEYQISTAEGDYKIDTEFTAKELELAIDIYGKFNELFNHQMISLVPEGEQTPAIFKRNVSPFEYQKTNRVERAVNFLLSARTTRNLATKIAFYMCIYEALFSGIEKGEIAHQIAERTALYIGAHGVDRRKIYSLIKTAYGIRSSFFHGQLIKQSETELKEISKQVDDYTRKILLSVMQNDAEAFLQKPQELEKSFLELILSDKKRTKGMLFETNNSFIPFK